MEKITLSRQQLYDMVWTEPMLALAKKYNISDRGLRKICIRMNIPVPKMGHWAKVKFGKPIRIVRLPADYSGKSDVTLTERSKDAKESDPFISSTKQRLVEIRNDPNLPLTVPDRLTNPDKLVIAARESLTKVKRNHPHYKGIVNTGSGELNIRVAPDNIGRALRFMDALIKLLWVRGHILDVQGYKTYVMINEQQIEIRLVEKVKMVKIDDRWCSTKFHPSGILTFRFEQFLKDEWVSGLKPLEDQLPNILLKLESEAKRSKGEHQRIDEWHRQREEKQRLKEEHHSRVKKEMSDFKKLIKQAKRLQRVVFLREYISIVEERAKKAGSINDEFRQWIEWASAKANWYDPLTNKKDELLGLFDDIDKIRDNLL